MSKLNTGLTVVYTLTTQARNHPIPQLTAVCPLRLKVSSEETASVHLTGPLVLQCGWKPSEAQMCSAVAGADDKVIQQQGAALWLSARLQTAVWSCAGHMWRLLYSGNYLRATTTQKNAVIRQKSRVS